MKSVYSQVAHAISLAVIAVIAISVSSSAQAQLPPSTQPLVINKPGSYVLNRGIKVASGDAITITANGVTLDLNGHTVTTDTPGNGRGVAILNVSGVSVSNGKIGPFQMNVMADTVTNLSVHHLQIVGNNLPTPSGPSEMGFALIKVRGADIANNIVTSCSLGLIIRGGASGGNAVHNNVFVGGADTSRNLLGVCWNPLAGGAASDPGPKGDRVYNNHISQFQRGLSFSAGTTGGVATENVIAYINAPFSPSTPGSNLVDDSNKTIQVAP